MLGHIHSHPGPRVARGLQAGHPRENRKCLELYFQIKLNPSVLISVCAFNVSPMTVLLLPLWPGDAKRLLVMRSRYSLEIQGIYITISCCLWMVWVDVHRETPENELRKGRSDEANA